MARSCGIDPDPWQAAVLRSPAKRILLNCSRQSGKSTTVSFRALHKALYQPKSLTLIVCPAERQSKEMLRTVHEWFEALGRPVAADTENKLELELANGSRIVALPGKDGTIRGYKGVSLLIIDEAAWVPDSLYRAVRPMLAVSGGELIALSTPAGKRGWWHEEWDKRPHLWRCVEVPATHCPRIPAEFLAEERETLGPFFDQEYMCQFLDELTQVFGNRVVEQAMQEDLAAWAV